MAADGPTSRFSALVFFLLIFLATCQEEGSKAGNESDSEPRSSEAVSLTEKTFMEMDTNAKDQINRLLVEETKCDELVQNYSRSRKPVDRVQQLSPQSGGPIACPIVWDGALCWPETSAGRTQSQPCPTYVHGFNHSALATRTCTKAGSWHMSQSTNESWTNYTACKPRISHHSESGIHNAHFDAHVGNIQLVTKVGYTVSLATLLVAFVILSFNKRLRCPRNNLHLQLFLSFIIRSFVFHVKSSFFTMDVSNATIAEFLATEPLLSLSNDDGHFAFVERSDTPSCKLFTVVWQYSLLANYNWILMEGMYLHNLVFLHIFNDNSSILKYIIVGWGLPLLFIVPWTVVRALYEDRLCWTTNQNIWYFWIIRGPITISIILNFVFFINITRVLFLKMFAPAAGQMNRGYNYSKWFKSTLVLVPLFGVHYAFLLLFNSLSYISHDMEVVWLYVDLLFTSFQGFFVALLYCFLNGEVQQEVRKWWRGANCIGTGGRGRNSILASTGDGLRKESKDSRSPSPSPNNYCPASGGCGVGQRESSPGHLLLTKDIQPSCQLIEPLKPELQGSSESIL